MMGTLYILATPIGNLKDITLRAIDVLSSVDYVLCEDTRVTGRLLDHFEIKKPMVSFNEFNEGFKAQKVLDDLSAGSKIAIVSDSGTPLISDPGYKLVREAIGKGIRVETIPGPSAVIAALTLSGLPPDKFLFMGFLPKKEGRRMEILKNTASVIRLMKVTVVIYESPYRVIKTLSEINDVFGDIDMVLCRELTKMHEEVRRGNVSELINHFLTHEPRGEFVVLF